MNYKLEIAKRLSKYASRETIAGIMTVLGMIEAQATPEQWTYFGIAVTLIFRVSKIVELWLEVKSKVAAPLQTEKVETITDTQDIPSKAPNFNH